MSKGDNRRPEAVPGSYDRNWDRIFRKQFGPDNTRFWDETVEKDMPKEEPDE